MVIDPYARQCCSYHALVEEGTRCHAGHAPSAFLARTPGIAGKGSLTLLYLDTPDVHGFHYRQSIKVFFGANPAAYCFPMLTLPAGSRSLFHWFQFLLS